KPKDINHKMWDAHDDFPTKYTQSNYAGLDSLAGWLKQKNIKFIFVQAPIKKSYANTSYYRQRINTHFDKCRSIIENQGGIYLNYYNTAIFTDSLFVDQYHLQNTGAIIFTKQVVADLKKVIK
ncbi:MAG: D-alanyl-lipoteichoic acid biosynthesis protein DltD, partial [Mucilaginibacter sp.]